MSNTKYLINLYTKILNTLTHDQYELISYGQNESYHEKIERIRLVSSNPETLNLCKELKFELKKVRMVSGESY